MTRLVPNEDMPDLLDKLQELYELDDHHLSSNDIDFIEDLSNWEGTFTEAQAGWLEGLHNRVIGGGRT